MVCASCQMWCGFKVMGSFVERNVRIDNIKEVVKKNQTTSGKSQTLFLRVMCMCEKKFPMLIAPHR